ncbi:LysM peptidoglycan-binding domain-containing protein [Actinotalea ferrariae]|nr:LysM peptidoglycan-binding domain-containing protein [Actinotalea ferrariae]
MSTTPTSRGRAVHLVVVPPLDARVPGPRAQRSAASAAGTGAGVRHQGMPERQVLRLTRRGRAAAVLLAGGIVLGGVLSAQSAAAGGPQGAVPVSAHVVRPGDTVWEIATSVAAPGEDVRDVVARIVELNGLEAGGLQVGERLVVPVG